MTYIRKVLATIKLFTETTWLSLGISENQWPNPQRTEHAAPFFPFPYVSRSRSQWLPARSHLYLTLKNHLDSLLKLQPLEPASADSDSANSAWGLETQGFQRHTRGFRCQQSTTTPGKCHPWPRAKEQCRSAIFVPNHPSQQS